MVFATWYYDMGEIVEIQVDTYHEIAEMRNMTLENNQGIIRLDVA